jgi:hypothetical protein
VQTSHLMALAFMAVASCASVVPMTAARLAATDPLTADPAGIELAVILPEGLSVNPGSARLEFGAERGSESLKGSFVLQDRPMTSGLDMPKGATARRFGLTAEDAEKLRALQARIALWKQNGTARGTLGLGIGACLTGDGPAPDATGSVLVRLEPGARFLPLIDDGRLSDILGADTLAAIRPCTGAE